MTVSLCFDPDISAIPHAGMVDETTGKLIDECRAWCERHIPSFVESFLDGGLRVFFKSHRDRELFLARFCEAG